MKFVLRLRRRLARWRPATTTRVLVISSLFGVLILPGIYMAREHTTLFQSGAGGGAVGIPGGAAGATSARPGPADLAAGDSAARFRETGIGQVLIMSSHNDSCRRLLFDNRTGRSREVNEVYCSQKPSQVVEEESPKRLDTLRKSFQR